MKRTQAPIKSPKSPPKPRPKPSKSSPPAKKPAARQTSVKSSPVGKTLPPAAPSPAVTSARIQTKQSQLIALLRSAAGATLAQMMALTGWQPHTVRGMLSGSLRKRLGLNVQSQVVGDERVYRIVEVAAK